MAADPGTKILFIGDMHLGRRPSGVPAHLAATWDLELRDLGPRAAWLRAVDEAMERGVDAVALAGDLVNQDDDLFEAKALLEDGIKRLAQEGIVVCAVAGNHDTRILPELADLIPELHLLGPGGTWSAQNITGAGAPVRIVGWSFPAAHHHQSPLVQPPPEADSGLVTIGLLHCDLDVARSSYAPVQSRALEATNYDRWFLGHIHRPSSLEADGPGYLGSLTGLDVNETGGHGPVLINVDARGGVTAERLLLAPLRWVHHDVSVDVLEEALEEHQPEKSLRSFLLQNLTELADQLKDQLSETRAVGLRLLLTGRLSDPAALDRALQKIDTADLITRHGGTLFFVKDLTSEVVVRVDLLALSRRSDPAGLLARQLLLLDRPGVHLSWSDDPEGEARALIDRARRRLERLDREQVFQGLDSGAQGSAMSEGQDQLSNDDIKQLLIRGGQRALGVLLAQTGGDHATG